ncbi:MAG: prolyl oligopeptidase family serine peptidase [Crocinitomicaceae bacterium]|nr:prolyl oligopeptidase family serine peptidase [Crocinitomicaceae bacterium]
MKTPLFIALFLMPTVINAQHHNHTHEIKPSTARSIWGDFAEDELVKTKLVDYTSTPIAKKVLKNGKPVEGFEYVDSIEVHSMVYDSDGLMVTGFMVRPKEKGEYPCIIFNRGGNRDFGQLLVGTALTYMGKIASWGYIVAASNYRGNSNSEGSEQFGGSDVNDVLNLIPALGQLEGADTSRIGMLGISRGGMMGYMALKEQCNIKALVVIGGLSNLFTMKEDRPEMEDHVYAEVIPNYNDSTKQLLESRSAAFWADKMCKDTKILILHGEKDKSVSVEQAREMHKKLATIGHDHIYIEFAKDNHGILKHEEDVSKWLFTWFDKYVYQDKIFSKKANKIEIN